MTKAPDEVAHLFDGIADPPGNAGHSIYPGYPGYVMANGRVRQMAWGFPLVMKGKTGQPLKPNGNRMLIAYGGAYNAEFPALGD